MQWDSTVNIAQKLPKEGHIDIETNKRLATGTSTFKNIQTILTFNFPTPFNTLNQKRTAMRTSEESDIDFFVIRQDIWWQYSFDLHLPMTVYDVRVYIYILKILITFHLFSFISFHRFLSNTPQAVLSWYDTMY